MLSTKHGQKLFMQSNGTPMVFHLPPGQTKKKLAPLIKRYGGEITSRNLNNVIHLVDEKLWTSRLLSSSSDLHYWPTYIIDCVKQDSLLDLDLYKCSKGKHLMRKISLEEGEDGTDEYDFTFEDNAGRAVVANKKGRMHYTKAEDMKILKYLMENGEYRRAKGIAVWTTMEKLQITPHPAQSMMARFRKVILGQLDAYNIPDNWKTRLTGDFSYFAPTATTTTRSRAARVSEGEGVTADTASPQPSTSRVGQQKSKRTNKDPQTLNDGVVIEIENEETGDSFDQQLLQMAKAGEQKVGGDETCTGVGAGDPEVGANEPSRSTAEPVVNGAEKEHPSAKKRRVDRAENKCDESREEEETLVLPCISSPQSRLRKKLEKRHKRSPQRSAQRAPSLAGSSQSEVEFQTLERTPRRRGQGQGQASAGVPSVRDTPSTNSTLLCPVTPPVHEFLLSASPVAKAGSLPCACEEKEKSGKHKGGKKVKRLTALGAVRALSHEFDLSLKEAQVLFWRNSGHVDATRYWIMTGYTLPGHYYWTEEEDGVLQTCQPDHPDWQRLEETYSLSAVLQRIQWLQDTAH